MPPNNSRRGQLKYSSCPHNYIQLVFWFHKKTYHQSHTGGSGGIFKLNTFFACPPRPRVVKLQPVAKSCPAPVSVNSFIGRGSHSLSRHCLPLLSFDNDRVKWLQQKPHNMQSLTYNLSGPLLKKKSPNPN